MLFTERLQQALSEAHSSNKPVAVMFLDLDRFKIINDIYDHHTGDLLLQLVAQRLQSIMRDCDTVARLGGDEFIFLFPALKSTQDARVLAQKILKVFASVFSTESYEIYITASIGISIYPTDGADATILIKNADSSMNHAKEQGGNNYQFYSPALDFKSLEELTLGNSLHKAVEANQLILHYQPQIDLSNGKIFGVETLVRWQHPDWGLMPPKEFIALAEDIGIIIPISEWIMSQAFTQMKKWGASGLAPEKIAVNLSVRQFKEKNLLETISKLLETSGLNPGLLELEITESIIMHNPEETIATIRSLRSLGISFSIDDFGTGYSSLNYLKYLPVSRLKIAKCFIDGITTDPNDRNITKTIINLAHNLGMKVIAEGVETLDQLEFLRRYECDEIQGYLFYRPLPEETVQQLLAEQREEKTFSENTACHENYNILL
jgi:diguanylate cyclase (GGDEF)-like protein